MHNLREPVDLRAGDRRCLVTVNLTEGARAFYPLVEALRIEVNPACPPCSELITACLLAVCQWCLRNCLLIDADSTILTAT